ncbi:MAG: T9SS type A sorting domain-containing protein [Bacteroidales bacterium]|nr:T9SS type A sorting domain-containing protein [Bacteroidales bacterium]
MKKLFTLLMILAVASIGYAQVAKISRSAANLQKAETFIAPRVESEAMLNVQTEPTMTRVEGNELDFTFYDWQSNHAARTWTKVWDNGKVDFAFTIATDNAYSDRGTGIVTYDSNTGEWSGMGARVENEKTGFGSIAQYKEHGLVVAAHTATECHVYVTEDRDAITAGSMAPTSALDNTNEPTWPAVMTSGPNRDIIHVVANAYNGIDGVADAYIYFRSTDGGVTWDKENVILPYMTKEYGCEWNSNGCYWMETTEDNCLALVISNSWSDGFVLCSYDDGETWEKKLFYSHPCIDPANTLQPGDTLDFYLPRYVSAVWSLDHKLKIAYEWNYTDGTSSGPEGHYSTAYGGVAYWGEDLPYGEDGAAVSAIPGNLTPGEPFIIDTAYLNQDIFGAMWWWSDQTHDLWPEYIGYLSPVREDGTIEPLDELQTTAFISDGSLTTGNHGHYNSGICAFPVLMRVPGSDDLVAIWSALDENHKNGDNFYYHLFANYSPDGGLTWGNMTALCGGEDYWMYENMEMVWPQAAIIGDELIIVCQTDETPGSYVQSDDTNGADNCYYGMVFSLNDLFGPSVSVPEVSHNTKMMVSPNPATTQLNVNLNQNSEIVIYTITGQVVSRVKGHVGPNTINVSSLSSGVYFINAGSDTQKFVVK